MTVARGFSCPPIAGRLELEKFIRRRRGRQRRRFWGIGEPTRTLSDPDGYHAGGNEEHTGNSVHECGFPESNMFWSVAAPAREHRAPTARCDGTSDCPGGRGSCCHVPSQIELRNSIDEIARRHEMTAWTGPVPHRFLRESRERDMEVGPPVATALGRDIPTPSVTGVAVLAQGIRVWLQVTSATADKFSRGGW